MVFSSYLYKNDSTVTKMKSSTARRSKSDWLRILCLVLAALSTMLAGAIVGAVSHSYYVYTVQRATNNPWWLPLWPQHFDTTGTRILVGAGAGIVLLNVAYIIISITPKLKFSTRSLFSAVTALGLSAASNLLAVFSIAFVAILNKHTQNSDTIQTWTCRFSKAVPGTMIMSKNAADMSNDKFGTLCQESKFGFWGMVTVLILQFLLFFSAAAQWLASRKPGLLKDTETGKGYDF